jgi:hypothetical protein
MTAPRPTTDGTDSLAHRRAAGRRHSLLLVMLAAAFMIAGLVMTSLSISSTPDTPCGSIRDSNFEWSIHSQCGVGYVGTVVLFAVIVVTACELLGLAWLVRSGRSSVRVAYWLLAFVAAVATVCFVALVVRVSTWHEPVVRRGWVGVRNLTAWTTIGLSVAAWIVGKVSLGGDDEDRLIDCR